MSSPVVHATEMVWVLDPLQPIAVEGATVGDAVALRIRNLSGQFERRPAMRPAFISLIARLGGG